MGLLVAVMAEGAFVVAAVIVVCTDAAEAEEDSVGAALDVAVALLGTDAPGAVSTVAVGTAEIAGNKYDYVAVVVVVDVVVVAAAVVAAAPDQVLVDIAAAVHHIAPTSWGGYTGLLECMNQVQTFLGLPGCCRL